MNKKSSILAKIRELFAQEMMAADYETTDGKIIRCLGDSLRVGEKVVEVVSGKEQDIFDGTYRLNDGRILEVAAGVIKDITEVEKGNVSNTGQIEQMAKNEGMPNVIIEKMADYKNEIDAKLEDGTEVKVLSKGDALSVGDMVLVKDAEGNFVKAPQGEHKLEGGLTIEVDDEGFINELETAETAEEMGKDKMKEDEMRRMFEALGQLTSVVTSLKEKFESVEKTNSSLTERFEKFAAEPSTGSVATPKKELSRTATKQERAKYFGSI
jgi:hypothetical protein